MNVHHYHPETGEYLGVSAADPDPLDEGRWLIPAHATTIEPPSKSSVHCWPVFNGNEWAVVDDYRGITYWLPDGTEWKTKELGICPPDGALTEKPVPPEPTLEERIEAVNAARQVQYSARVSPLLEEALIKQAMGLPDESTALMNVAIAERLKIQEELPLPTE